MLSVHLANIKSSGVYRFIFDRSVVSTQAPQTMRLVVGYSEKGPFNTVTYVKNEAEFKELYGGISKKLEKYGCFFHRTALQCLAKEPILCLNVKDFSEETLQGISFSPVWGDDEEGKAKIKPESIAVKNIYDRSRLWTLSPEVLPAAFEISGKTPDYFSISATDTKKNSNTVYVRPSLAKGYDVTLRDWYINYNNGEWPEYLEGCLDTLVSDYLVDVYIFRGKFTSEVASSENFVNYFDIKSDDEIYVKDYIENAYGEKIDALEALSEVAGSGFLTKYTGSLIPYFKNIDGTWMSIDLMMSYDSDRTQLMAYLNEEMLEDDPKRVAKINLGGYNNEDWEELGSLTAHFGSDNTAAYMYNTWNLVTDETSGKLTWSINKEASANDFTYGDAAVDVLSGITVDSVEDSEGYFTIDSTSTIAYTDGEGLPLVVGDKFVADPDKSDMNLVTIMSIKKEDTKTGIEYTYTFNAAPAVIPINGVDSIIRYNSKLTAHAGVIHPANEESAAKFGNDAHNGIYLAGYDYSNAKPVSSKSIEKNKWINAKLDALKDKGIREALTNDTDVLYRYIVDSFEAFPEENLRARLALIAKDKKNAIVLSNFPSMKTFGKIDSFCDDSGLVNTKYIAAGYNRSKAPGAQRLTLPSEINGAAYIAFYTPCKFNDNGITTIVPSAGLVSNNFMDKYTSRQPYYVVAGPVYGHIYDENLIGPDFNFTRGDLDILEPLGVNCLVYRPQRGTYINSNQTAKQNPVSGLSKINIVELVIYLQDEIAEMLRNYQWEMNTQTLRDAVKKKADMICENVKYNHGLYDYYNVCDEPNNTDEVIDNEMLVLSTAIEPVKGAGKMVHELTIYRKGGMSSIIR